MRIGEHRNGKVEAIEGRQMMAKCECGWSSRVQWMALNENDIQKAKQLAHEEAEMSLAAHQQKHNQNPDKGTQLENGD